MKALSISVLFCIICSATPSSGSSACSFSAPCPLKGGELLKQPDQLVSSNGILDVKIDVDVTDFTVDWLTLQRRTYNGKVPAETWRVKRSDVIKLDLINHLEEPEKTEPINTPRYPNTTNMHTHGLHISPQSPEDNVLVLAPPGGSLHYEYNIEENHPSGAFWYHPHVHGSTLFQLHSGMAGMIIVEDDPEDSTMSNLLQQVSCPLNCHNDIQLVFQPTLLYTINSNAYKFTSMQDGIEDNVENLDQYTVSSTGESFKDWITNPENGVNYFTTNGQIEPVLNLKTGELKRFRMLNGGGGPSLEVELVDVKGTNKCETREIAIDGVYLDEARPLDKSMIATSTRIDWLVTCSQPGTYVLRSNPSDDDIMSIGSLDRFTGTLLTIKVNGDPIPSPDLDTELPARPDYISDFTNFKDDEVHGRFVVELGPTQTLNRELFPPNLVFRYQITVGEIQEWYFVNPSPTKNHPLHLHVNHFQVIEYTPYTGPVSALSGSDFMFYSQENETCFYQHDGYSSNLDIPFPNNALKYLGHDQRWAADASSNLGYAQAGEFRDMLLVPPLSNITVRFMPHQFTGDLVLHCHLLNHEDKGMMMVVAINNPGEVVETQVPSGDAYPGTCMRCDPFPFNKDMSNCSNVSSFDLPCDVDPERCGSVTNYANKFLTFMATLLVAVCFRNYVCF